MGGRPATPAAIVEFGPSALFARTHPGIALWIHSGRSTVRAPGLAGGPFGLAGLAGLVRLLRRDAPGFIACHVPATRARTTALERAGHAAVARLSRRPVVGLDFGDDMRLSRPALRVIDASRLFFKRELPADPLDLLPDGAGSAERRLLERNSGKIRPVSIGLASWRILDMPEPLPPKSIDVFFAGALNSDVRRQGAALLPRLRDEGISVDFAEGGLDRSSYLRRMAAARLAWSPEGLGWQCFRHFEAAAAGTVPVINRPRITMPHPLRDGEHCFHYAPGGDDLLAVIRRALADPARLERMAGAARRHVLAHHTHEAIAGGILNALAGILPPADHAAVRWLDGVPASAGAGR